VEKENNMKNSITFTIHEMKPLAEFIAGLVIAGVVFTCDRKGDHFVVTLTGGY
jgi:hypothetical protein